MNGGVVQGLGLWGSFESSGFEKDHRSTASGKPVGQGEPGRASANYGNVRGNPTTVMGIQIDKHRKILLDSWFARSLNSS
jgi:hypothetical protein